MDIILFLAVDYAERTIPFFLRTARAIALTNSTIGIMENARSQTPLWALSEEEMAAAGWTGTQGEDLNGQPAERSSVLQEGFGVLPSVWDPMRDDMPDETASGGKEKPARRFWPGVFRRLFSK